MTYAFLSGGTVDGTGEHAVSCLGNSESLCIFAGTLEHGHGVDRRSLAAYPAGMDTDDPFAGPLPDSLPPAPLVGEPGPEHDRAVVAALYRAAVGGEVWEEKVDKFGQVTRLAREVRPDVAAAKKWLESRTPEAWGEKRTQEFRVIVARIDGQERDAVGLTIAGELDTVATEPVAIGRQGEG